MMRGAVAAAAAAVAEEAGAFRVAVVAALAEGRDRVSAAEDMVAASQDELPHFHNAAADRERPSNGRAAAVNLLAVFQHPAVARAAARLRGPAAAGRAAVRADQAVAKSRGPAAVIELRVVPIREGARAVQ